MHVPSQAWLREQVFLNGFEQLKPLLWKLSRYSVNSFRADPWLPSASFLHTSKQEVMSTWPPLEQQWQSQWQISSIVCSQISQSTRLEHAIVYKLLQLSDPSQMGTGERQAEQTWISALALALISCLPLHHLTLLRAPATSVIYREQWLLPCPPHLVAAMWSEEELNESTWK